MYRITKTYYLFDPEVESDKIDEFEKTHKNWKRGHYDGYVLYTTEVCEEE